MSRPLKKSKLECDGGNSGSKKYDNNPVVTDELIEQAWQHYRNYTDSSSNCSIDEDNEDGNDNNSRTGTGDEDELMEVLQLFADKDIQPISKDLIDFTTLCTKRQLLPVLISVSAYVLAVNAIEEYLHKFEKIQNTDTDTDDIDKVIPIDTVRTNLDLAIRMFPQNAAAWTMAANFARITYRLHGNLKQTILWYEQAVICASQIRTQMIKILDDDDDEESDGTENKKVDDDVKEWIELLLLNQVAGVELLLLRDVERLLIENNVNDGHDPSDDPEAPSKEECRTQSKKSCCEKKCSSKNNNCIISNDKKTKDSEEEEEDDERSNQDNLHTKETWSQSSIEETARFMLAMLNSMAGNHDEALQQLLCFPHLTHRLHPNVWRIAKELTKAVPNPDRSPTDPGLYRTVNDNGILPESLHERLCSVFAPGSPYWIESDYSNRGYYSFFMDLPKGYKIGEKVVPTNVVEDVVCNHLLPVVRKHLTEAGQAQEADKICGYEWWVHTRAIQANLGHNLHFDTDEWLLAQDKQISHPIISSVLYLTGDRSGGPTIVFDQTPEAVDNPKKAWLSTPINNSCLLFPGNLLHGVLPCSGSSSSTTIENDNTGSPDNILDISKLWIPNGRGKIEKLNRLTFMVGFWTRRVPDNMKERRLYGPCGTLPPLSSSSADQNDNKNEEELNVEHTWVDRVYDGYHDESTTKHSHNLLSENDIEVKSLQIVDDPWDEFRKCNDDEVPPLHLETPRGVDHRFFVSKAPQCFTDSLFEKDDDEEKHHLMMSDDDDELPFAEDEEEDDEE